MAQTENAQSPSTSVATSYAGGCHCGAVRFEAELDLSKGVTRCNCTICMRIGAASTLVKPSAFRLVKGAESLGEYRVGTSPNARSFCKHCGVQCFGQGYVEDIGGAFCSINVNCLDDVDPFALPVGYWDGRHNNWHAGLRREPWPVRG